MANSTGTDFKKEAIMLFDSIGGPTFWETVYPVLKRVENGQLTAGPLVGIETSGLTIPQNVGAGAGAGNRYG